MVMVMVIFYLPRAEYEELKAAKEKAEEDTIFSFKRKKGCQAERKQVRSTEVVHHNPKQFNSAATKHVGIEN